MRNNNVSRLDVVGYTVSFILSVELLWSLCCANGTSQKTNSKKTTHEVGRVTFANLRDYIRLNRTLYTTETD